MNKSEDFLVEVHTEELPPKALLKLAEAFCQQIKERLEKLDLAFESIKYFAAPRRLAVFAKNLSGAQPDQEMERKGPAVTAAFDAEGKPTPACLGFMRSCGADVSGLFTIKTPQGEWVGFRQKIPGKSVFELLPSMVEQALLALPIQKRMRWSSGETQFVRPVHSVILLFGDAVVPGVILGCETNRLTRGHRFHAPDWMTIPHAAMYESLLNTEGHVIADFAKRREMISTQASALLREKLGGTLTLTTEDNPLLDEVTGLVEWPVPLLGKFDEKFLALPTEVLIAAMEDHQRYFPVFYNDTHQLSPHFVTISNIQSHDAARVVQGNERVLRARLADAAFFYEVDQKETLKNRIERLKGVVFQAKLGTLYDKAERLRKLSVLIAGKIGADEEKAAQAGLLAKTDLTTDMVGEFPELQGVMGYYYALHDNEAPEVALAIKEHYMPRFSGDALPAHAVGQVLAVADRLDTLIGAFGVNQMPTGDKDPYGLRRAALGVLRILIEKQISLDLQSVLAFAFANYTQLDNANAVTSLLNFMQERLRAWYSEQGVPADVFAAVAAIGITNPLDAHKRIKAVQAFKQLHEAETLSIANKRVSNILSKYSDCIRAKTIDPAIFESRAEQELASQLEVKSRCVAGLYESGKYNEVLLQLAELRKPIDDFFDQVMVMTEDTPKRENRLLILNKLRTLFLQVADIALLQ